MAWVHFDLDIGGFDIEPNINSVVKCKVQHWHTKNTRELMLKYVNEDDCNWRFPDDDCELSYDYDVIAWEK